MIKKVEKGCRRRLSGRGKRTKAIIWRLSIDQKQMVDKLCEEEGMSIGGLLDRLLDDYLDAREA